MNSSAIRQARYHPVSRRLDLTFPDGDTYRYSRFPRSKFQALMAAESKGNFLNKEIKPKHRYKKLTD